MEILIKAGQLILSLSILVVLHEGGHFLPAKLFGTRVERFYLFFNPWFSLFKVKKGDTEYGIGWVPLGGYVKIAGMIDESMDTEQVQKAPEPYEFRAKPAWQRLIIMLGGVTVNLLLGMAIYAMILFLWGQRELPVEHVQYGVHCDSLMYDMGFEEGDRILRIDGKKPANFSAIGKELLLDNAKTVTIERDGKRKKLSLPGDLKEKLLSKNVQQPFQFRFPVVIDSVVPGKPAEKAGFRSNDSIVTVNGKNTAFWNDLMRVLQKNKGEKVNVGVYRNGRKKELEVSVTQKGKMGFYPKRPEEFLQFERKKYGFFRAIPAGIELAITTLTGYVASLKLIFTPEGAEQVGSFLTIGNLFPGSWDWHQFWQLTALLSIILAFMNLLPIPALDGGHVVFLLYEMVSGKAPGQKFMEIAQITGMIILFAILALAFRNDFMKFLW